jgi:hypothetical protein
MSPAHFFMEDRHMSLVKLSFTSKLDGIPSWSLEALTTCPGSKLKNGELVKACKGCYARWGHYIYPNVKAARIYNYSDWRRDAWEDDMVSELGPYCYHRWFDSGDCFNIKLAHKMLNVMRRTPWCRHWFPTRMHKFPRFRRVFEEMMALPNVMVRYSSDEVDGSFTPGLHGSTIVPSLKETPEGVKPCLAYLHGGKCSGCRDCWNKEIPVIGYVGHGQVMKKVIRIHRQMTLFEDRATEV